MSEEVCSVLPIRMDGDQEDISSHPTGTQIEREEAKNTQAKKRKEIAPRAKVWVHFRRFNVNGRQRAECNYCKKDYAADPGRNGTSTLNSHLRNCLKNPENKKDSQQTILSYQSSCKDSKEGSLGTWLVNQMRTRKALARMIIIDEQPFSIVDKEGFRGLMKEACPQFEMPSRFTTTRDCYEIYLEEKKRLKEYFKTSTQMVSLTTDTWTSLQNINYMCLTVHFIDSDWELQKKVLNFCPITSHKGEDIGKGVEKCLLDWRIDKVFSITVDNASSNDSAISYLKRKLVSWGNCLLGGKYLHMRCIAHIINLIVVDGLKEISESVQRVRAAVKYIRQSPNRFEKFKECVEMEKKESKQMLCLDVPTRWNSTYLMLETASKLVKAFDRFEDVYPSFSRYLLDDGIGVPNSIDWDNVTHYVHFLEHFYDLTLQISGSLYVTSNVVVHELSDILVLMKEWENSDDLGLSCMAIRMQAKYDKYWGNLERTNFTIFFAVVLDPRYKFKFLEWLIKRMYGSDEIVQLVKDELVKLFEEYQRVYAPQPSSSTSSTFSRKHSSGQSEENIKKKKGINRMEYQKLLVELGGIEEKSELERYFDDLVVPDDDHFEILQWWKKKGSTYPILTRMARDILAIPVSTVASESAFSTGGSILDPFRTSLTPKIVQALMCARDWLRPKSQPIMVEEDIHSLEQIENELSTTNVEPTTIIDI